MGEAKPTKGTAYNKREGYSTVYVFVPIGRGLVQEVAACGPTEAGQDEQQANADLITEAFTVHNTTGLTPSQLVERVKELEAVLQAAVDCGMVPKSSAADGGASKYSAQVLVADRIRAALSKARPNTADWEVQQAPAVAEPELCPYCNGSGDTVVMDSAGPDAHEVPANCPHCKGSGLLADAYQGVVDLLKKKEREYLDCCARLYAQPRTPTTEQAAPAAAKEPSP